MNKSKKIIGMALSACLCVSMLAGCGSNNKTETSKSDSKTENSETKKTMVIGDTTFNSSNEENSTNPHDAYSGWACIRYGIGETLVKYSDNMEIQPWLAKEWENVDELTWKITLQDNVKFSSGRDMDAEAVKQCLEHLIENHDRAKNDLKIASIDADGQVLTIHTSEPKPALLNYLGDPYGCIIDVDAGFENGIVAGTGPYIAVDCKTDDHLTLVKNENYWNGEPKIDELTIRTITDGNTLANALLSGEVQAAYGMAYESYPTFENDNFQFSQISTSRCFFGKMNFDESSVCADSAVRKAIAMGIDKESFVTTLLEGNGYPANGVFPEGSAFGGDKVTTESYDPEGAKKVLEEAGWKDSDGDGIREMNGKKISINYITYENRRLSDFAQAIQTQLADIGIEAKINSMDADREWNKMVAGEYDLCDSNWITVGNGDPTEYMANWYGKSDANFCNYKNAEYDKLYEQLDTEFDEAKRAKIIEQLQQILIDDAAVIVHGYYNSSMISDKTVSGANIHTADYYWLTTEIAPAK